MDFLKSNKIPISILAGAIIIGVFIYFSKPRSTTTPPVPPPTSQQQITSVLSPDPTVTSLPTPTALPTVDETASIKQAVLQKLGKNEESVEITISQKTDSHAKGNIREKEAVGGGYFLVSKTSTGWVVVYDGQSQPACDQIASYNFSQTMVPECVDSSGKVVDR